MTDEDRQALIDMGLSEEKADEFVNTRLKGLLNKRDELLGAQKELKQKLHQLQGDDSADVLRAQLKEMQDEQKRKDAEARKNYEEALAVERKRIEEREAELSKRAETAEQKYHRMLTEGAMRRAMREVSVDPAFEDAVIALHKDSVTVADEDTVVIGDKPVNDFFAEWAETDQGKRFIAAPKNSGAGAKGPSTGGKQPPALKRSEMSVKQKAAFVAEFGQEEYAKLPM